MMAEPQIRDVAIAAADDFLLRALAEQSVARGWSIMPAAASIHAESIVVVDFDDQAARRGVVSSIRAGGFAGPMLILGGEEPVERPEDEPLPRPVRLGLLLSRIAAHWARSVGLRRQIGLYEFAPSDRLLRHRETGEIIRLTELERKLVSFLADADGAPVGRDALLGAVWGYGAGMETHTVETHVWRLRQKIETDDPRTRILLGEPGGYRLLLADPSRDV